MFDTLPDAQVLARAGSPMPRPGRLLQEEGAFTVMGALACRLVAPLEAAGFQLLRAERTPPILGAIPPEAEPYESSGTGIGLVDTARGFTQLTARISGGHKPGGLRWAVDDQIIDPFRPDLRYPARSDREFDVLAERHLNTVRSAVRRSNALILSVGRGELWALGDGTVLESPAALPHAGEVSVSIPDVAATVADLRSGIAALRTINPQLRVLLLLDPAVQAATLQPMHVGLAASLGKAVLRLAMEQVGADPGVHYVPAFEIAGIGNAVGGQIEAATAAVIVAASHGEADAGEIIPVDAPAQEQGQAEASTATSEAAERPRRAKASKGERRNRLPESGGPAEGEAPARRGGRRRRLLTETAEAAPTPAKIVATPVDESGYVAPKRKGGKKAIFGVSAAEEPKRGGKAARERRRAAGEGTEPNAAKRRRDREDSGGEPQA